MNYEVEQKFEVCDSSPIREALTMLGASFREPIVQSDRYFNHPARDFGETDEAFRIRSVGDCHFVTYKGPKIDTTTKTRREIETPLGNGTTVLEQWQAILAALDFRPVAIVTKRRERAELTWEGFRVEAAFDEVEGLGSYVELELQADQDGLEQARASLLSLSERLALPAPQRRSYLEMLLDRQSHD